MSFLDKLEKYLLLPIFDYCNLSFLDKLVKYLLLPIYNSRHLSLTHAIRHKHSYSSDVDLINCTKRHTALVSC